MKPFEHKPYFEPNALEKLTKKTPKKNFLIDLNNLLSESKVDDLSPQVIKGIEDVNGRAMFTSVVGLMFTTCGRVDVYHLWSVGCLPPEETMSY